MLSLIQVCPTEIHLNNYCATNVIIKTRSLLLSLCGNKCLFLSYAYICHWLQKGSAEYKWPRAKLQLSLMLIMPLYSPSLTFALLQLAYVFECRLEAEVEAMAAAQVQEEVARAKR